MLHQGKIMNGMEWNGKTRKGGLGTEVWASAPQKKIQIMEGREDERRNDEVVVGKK